MLAPPASLLAFAAWLSGDGALAWCAIDLARQADPDYSLANLLAEALEGAVPPSAWSPRRSSPGETKRSDRAILRSMGEDVAAQEFSLADRVRYRSKLADCVRAFDRMLVDVPFDTSESTAGLEIEFSLVDDLERPTLTNAEVLDAIANPAFQTELGRFNVETNIPHREFAGTGLELMETDVRASLNDAEVKASGIGFTC